MKIKKNMMPHLIVVLSAAYLILGVLTMENWMSLVIVPGMIVIICWMMVVQVDPIVDENGFIDLGNEFRRTRNWVRRQRQLRELRSDVWAILDSEYRLWNSHELSEKEFRDVRIEILEKVSSIQANRNE